MVGNTSSAGAARGDGAAKESQGWGDRGRFRPYGQGRAVNCQAINKRLKENNQIQWRTINKIPLV